MPRLPMLIVVLVMIACGMLTAIRLLVYCCQHVLPLLGAIVAARLAFCTDGGFPGAFIAGVAGFVVVSLAFRIALLTARGSLARFVICGTFAVPGAVVGYCMSYGLLWSIVPSDVWRVCLASTMALIIAFGTVCELGALPMPGTTTASRR